MREYFKDLSNLISFIVGAIASFLLIVAPMTQVPYWIVAIIIFGLIVSMWLNAKIYLTAQDEKTNPCIPIIGCSHRQCLCKANNFLVVNSYVTFYECSGDFEELIAFGIVQNINSKGVAQIFTCPCDDQHASITAEYINDHKKIILVKPTITIDMISFITEKFQNP